MKISVYYLIYIILLFSGQFICVISEDAENVKELTLTMPPRPTTKPDTYLCTSFEMPSEPHRITAIEPHSDQLIAHHMLLFG